MNFIYELYKVSNIDWQRFLNGIRYFLRMKILNINICKELSCVYEL